MSATGVDQNRMTAMQWRVLALLTFSVFINYIDRGNLSVAARQLGDELGIDKTQLGLLHSAFFWTYALMQFVAGWVVDRTNVKWTYGAAFLIWSLATAATGWVNGFVILFLFRLLLGVGESVAYPSYSKVVAANYSERHRGVANALIDAGSKCGPALANLFGALFVAYYGWRALFIVLGFGSLIWIVPWAIWGPKDKPLAVALRTDAPTMAEIAAKRQAWGTFLGLFCGNYAWYFLLTWLPYYLETYRGFSKGKLALLGALPFFAIAASSTLSGYVSDHLIAKGYPPTRVRIGFIVTGLLLGTIMLPAAIVQDETTAIVLLVTASAFFGFFSANMWAVTQTLAGPTAAGKWTGMQNGIGNFSGVVCPTLSGYLADHTGSFVWPFAVVAGVLTLGAFSFGVLVREVKPIQWPRHGSSTEAPAIAAR